MRHPVDGPSRWVDPLACSSLCALILDDWHGVPQGTPARRVLPPSLYAEHVAPFLRFDAPLPNMLYAFGGRNQNHGPLNVVEMFDTWHGRWVNCPPMPTRRAGSGAAVLPDGRILIIGGYDERGIAEGLLASCDRYDPVQMAWSGANAVAPLTRARWGHGCATLGSKVLVVGGCSLQPHAQPREAFMETLRSCEMYDPAQDVWETCTPLQIARSGSRVVALSGDRYVAVIGGCDDVFGRAETQPTVELYDAQSGAWSLLSTRLSQPRTTAAAVAIGDQRLFIVGGAPSMASAELYDVALPADTQDKIVEEAQAEHVNDLSEGRMGCQAAVLELPEIGGAYPLSNRRSVVVVGGERCDDVDSENPRIRQFKSVPVFDVATSTWREDSVVPDLSTSRTAVALCVGRGRAVS